MPNMARPFLTDMPNHGAQPTAPLSWMALLFGLVIYFGSVFIAIFMLFSDRSRHRRRLLIGGLIVQALVTALILWTKGHLRTLGYREWYWADLYHVPVNILSGIYYSVVGFSPQRKSDNA